MRKVLFLSHVPYDSIYGAATSTRQHLKILSCEPVVFYLFQQCGLRFLKYREHDGLGVKAVIGNLDWLHDYGAERLIGFAGIRVKFTRFLRSKLEKYYAKKLVRFMLENEINVLHINSPVLSCLIE